jgi:hypothetical protein
MKNKRSLRIGDMVAEEPTQGNAVVIALSGTNRGTVRIAHGPFSGMVIEDARLFPVNIEE